ncbi:SPOR domain-containing protein [Mucilaginibacter sp. RS28]|uniref:SPOR domain-containing protein n=1 Tax=Mucilaginibacter straminoryzae TaxID=2932774 RepID=A0A9X1X6M8_9SPHI|nr:SPOR domain-containing protein [Mucilaginibacter straminoryzae]MCJ8211883.1 SPOR domain-containing protein [Mucilaginibacter straminoryzae]
MKKAKKNTMFQPLKAIIFLAMLLPFPSFAQTTPRGKVEVIKDSRIDTLIARRYATAKSGTGTTTGFSSNGYRVQIFSGSDRNQAFKAQAKFQDKYPDIRTYISYHEPNFKVRIGDFRTRLEAQKMLYELKPWFPLMFIISEKINPPKLDTDTPQ